MTLPKDKKPKKQEIDSMKIAVSESGIRAIHPDKNGRFCRTHGREVKRGNGVTITQVAHVGVD